MLVEGPTKINSDSQLYLAVPPMLVLVGIPGDPLGMEGGGPQDSIGMGREHAMELHYIITSTSAIMYACDILRNVHIYSSSGAAYLTLHRMSLSHCCFLVFHNSTFQ